MNVEKQFLKRSLVHVSLITYNSSYKQETSTEKNSRDNTEKHTQIQKWVCRAFLIRSSPFKKLHLHTASKF